MKRDQTLEVVWFKRDLRVEDHRPLAQAAAQAAAQGSGQGPVLPLYIAEPEFWQLPDASARQWAFVAEGLESLNMALAKRCLLYTSPSPRDKRQSRMPSSA